MYVEALEHVPPPGQTDSANQIQEEQDKIYQEQGATQDEPSEEEGANANAICEETGAHNAKTGATEECDVDDISATSSEIYERDGVTFDTKLAHITNEETHYPLLVPRPLSIDKTALAVFLNKAYVDNDKYWWRFVPSQIVNSTSTSRYMNLMLGGRAFHEVLMNQMTAKAGIKKHGEAAINPPKA